MIFKNITVEVCHDSLWGSFSNLYVTTYIIMKYDMEISIGLQMQVMLIKHVANVVCHMLRIILLVWAFQNTILLMSSNQIYTLSS